MLQSKVQLKNTELRKKVINEKSLSKWLKSKVQTHHTNGMDNNCHMHIPELAQAFSKVLSEF